MRSSSSFIPYPPGGRTGGARGLPVKGVADYLQSHDKMRLLLPIATRLAALQKACEAALPSLFEACAVLQLESNQLVISTRNGAVAAKLRQKLPELQEVLIRQGWQVNAIRLKVQVGKTVEKSAISKHLRLSSGALTAFSALEKALEPSARNDALKAALRAMMERHAGRK